MYAVTEMDEKDKEKFHFVGFTLDPKEANKSKKTQFRFPLYEFFSNNLIFRSIKENDKITLESIRNSRIFVQAGIGKIVSAEPEKKWFI